MTQLSFSGQNGWNDTTAPRAQLGIKVGRPAGIKQGLMVIVVGKGVMQRRYKVRMVDQYLTRYPQSLLDGNIEF